MKNPVYLSTGAFIGRLNGRNWRLACDHWNALTADGLEVMVFEEFYGRLDEIARNYVKAQLPCPVVHIDKSIGDRICVPDAAGFSEAKRLFQINCDFAKSLGAKRIVTHAWGYPNSDKDFDVVLSRVPEMIKWAGEYGLEMLIENCACMVKSPLERMLQLREACPEVRFIVDTRPAHFHRELAQIVKCGLYESGHIAHMHINDYGGAYKDWEALYPIPPLGEGTVDFRSLFEALQRIGYAGTFTIENPSMLKGGVDAERFNRWIRWVRTGFIPT